MRLFDAHDHLQNYPGEKETAEALAAASAAGIKLMLCNGTHPGDWEKVLALAGCKGVVPFFGLHPWFLDKAQDGWPVLLKDFLLRTSSGVGEIGLDKAIAADLDKQEEVFKVQLRIARELRRPVSIHCVRAWGRLVEIIKEERPGAFLLHAYGGPPELMGELAGLGAYFSFGARLLDPERGKLRKALKAAPPDRLLFETEDPESGLGPLQLAELIRIAAGALGQSPEALSELGWNNGEAFLGSMLLNGQDPVMDKGAGQVSAVPFRKV